MLQNLLEQAAQRFDLASWLGVVGESAVGGRRVGFEVSTAMGATCPLKFRSLAWFAGLLGSTRLTCLGELRFVLRGSVRTANALPFALLELFPEVSHEVGPGRVDGCLLLPKIGFRLLAAMGISLLALLAPVTIGISFEVA